MSDIGFVTNRLGVLGQEHPLQVITVDLPRKMNVSPLSLSFVNLVITRML